MQWAKLRPLLSYLSEVGFTQSSSGGKAREPRCVLILASPYPIKTIPHQLSKDRNSSLFEIRRSESIMVVHGCVEGPQEAGG